ncbi:MAG TPA: sugar ABC transporter permease [Actinomycetota bacterium]|nr:sugar ABC transporter permease [Actinomycetota bacterium]
MRRERGIWLLVAPYLLGLTVLVIAPVAVTFSLSLFDYDLIRPAVFRGLANFQELARDETFRTSLWNSALFAAWAVPLRLLGALGLALLLHRRYRAVGAYRSAVYLPTVIPDVAYGLVWLWILNPLYGPLNLVLGAAGLSTPSWLTEPATAQAAVIVMSLFTIGEGFVVALAVRQQVPHDLYEVAVLEGAGSLRTFRTITLPLMAPALLLLLFRDAVYSFQVSFVPALVVTHGGPPPSSTTFLPLFVYREGFTHLRYGYAAAASLAMLAVTALIVAIQWAIIRRWRRTFTP